VQCAATTLQDVSGARGPDEQLGVLVVMIDIVADCRSEFFDIAKDAAAKPVRVRSRKKRSTMFSQDELAAVKCK
jgi:hypothetical protein